MFKKTAPTYTPEQLAAWHQRAGESELRRANKAGRLEAQTVHATRAIAHATLATSYILGGTTLSVVAVPEHIDDDLDEDGS